MEIRVYKGIPGSVVDSLINAKNAAGQSAIESSVFANNAETYSINAANSALEATTNGAIAGAAAAEPAIIAATEQANIASSFATEASASKTSAATSETNAAAFANAANLAAQSIANFYYTTKSLMDADLAHVANVTAMVLNDPTSTNNGLYIKLGASGAGSWQKSAYVPPVSDSTITTSKVVDSAITTAKRTTLGEIAFWLGQANAYINFDFTAQTITIPGNCAWYWRGNRYRIADATAVVISISSCAGSWGRLYFNTTTNAYVVRTSSDLAATEAEILVAIFYDLGSYAWIAGMYKINGSLLADLNAIANVNELISVSSIRPFLNINDYDCTTNVSLSNNSLTMTGTGGANHTNVALYNPINDARGIEVTVGNNPTRVRLAFGYDTKNFTFITMNSFADRYRISAGRLGTYLGNISPNTVPDTVSGDRVKAVLQGQTIQLFKNGVLCGTIPYSASLNVPVNRKLKAGIAWRDYATTNFNVKNIKVYGNQFPRYMHFSVDDVISPLKDLTTNAATYTTIFNNATLAYFKTLHDTYGAVITLNLFYTDGAWNLGSMTNKFKAEFAKNSDWLRFAFHAYQAADDYGSGAITTATALTYYNTMMDAIRAFAGEDSIDTMPRTHYYAGTLDMCRAWRDSECGIKGFLTSDDDRAVVYYLNAVQRDTMQKCCEFYDETEKLMFVKTLPRLDNNDIAPTLETQKNDPVYSSTQHALAIFCHDGFNDTVKSRVESCLLWAKNNGYTFAFPMDCIPKC